MTDSARAAEIIATLELQSHPEGGYYREWFRSPVQIRPDDARSVRSALTTIYFLLIAGQGSRWHRVLSDEVWHFYEGDPLELFWLDTAMTKGHRAVLGTLGDGTAPVQVIPAHCWQAARPLGAYTLVGCTVGPGFDFADFTLIETGTEEEKRIIALLPETTSLL